jgi:hypothetical protein
VGWLLNGIVQRGTIMADDKKNRGEPDRSRINTSEDYEVQYWSKKFGVSAEKLKDAVKKAGNSPEAVQKALNK